MLGYACPGWRSGEMNEHEYENDLIPTQISIEQRGSAEERTPYRGEAGRCNEKLNTEVDPIPG